jgi:branched-chain amino acid transport system substrate-binding protein
VKPPAPSIRRRHLAIVTGALGLLGACGSDGGTVPDATEPPRTTTTVPRESDGVLRLGLLIPRSGTGASLGDPLVPIAESLVDSINGADGFGGRDVELVIRDEGNDTATALAAVERLVGEDGVDAIVGPLSSNVALGVLPTLVRSDIGVCSPAATSALLNNFPDQGLFARTAPTDSLITLAMAQVIAQTGESSAALAFPDDRYGRRLAAELRRNLSQQGVTITVEIPYLTADESYVDDVETIPDDTRIVALVGNQESGPRFLSTLLTNSSLDTIVLNDALSNTSLANDAGLERLNDFSIVGVAHDVAVGFDAVVSELGERRVFPNPAAAGTVRQPVPFATSLVDCINLLVLAARASNSDDPMVFMASMIPASRVGSSCNTFESCAELLARGLNIDYNGPTGLLGLTPSGDPGVASFVNYGFSDTGEATYRSLIGVISSP